MFEQSNNDDVLCGVIKENGEYAPIFCNEVTGECYFPDPLMSYNRLISELSVGDPLPIEYAGVAAAVEEGIFGECIGVIYGGDTIMKLVTDELAVRVPVDDPKSVGDKEFTIDIYADYDEG